MAKFFLLLLLALPAWANPALDARTEQLARELRCPVCDNQSLADSSAPLAQDLKQRLRDGLAAGRSEAELRQELVQRYGEQVLYQPPLRSSTALLWAGPALLLLVGLRWLAGQRRPEAGDE